MKRWVRISLCFSCLAFVHAAAQDPAGTSFVQSPAAGGAVIWYLGHCGYAVRTQNHFLIFDYQEKVDGRQPKVRPEKPTLISGWIDPEEIKDLSVRVFVSHSHEDHYDPVILEWKKTVPDIAYYFGWKVSDDPSLHCLEGPRAGLTSGGLEIATINSHHSGVPEVGWMVKVDGLAIYHNGDCMPDNPAAEHGDLRTKTDTIDLAFVPPLYRESEKYGIQNLDLFKKFRVRAAFPMHFEAGAAAYQDFRKAFRSRFLDSSVQVPTRLGERFVTTAAPVKDRTRP